MSSKKSNSSKTSDPVYEHCVVGVSRSNTICNYCKKNVWGGITRMKHHLARNTGHDVTPCPTVPDEVREQFVQIVAAIENSSSKSKSIRMEEVDEVSANVISNKGRGSCGKQQTMNGMLKSREPACKDICRFLYGNAIAFNVVKGSLFKRMIKSIGDYGPGLKPPSYHEARVSYLKKELDQVNESMQKYKDEWKITGCTLMSDGWTDVTGRSITNFLVNSPRGTIFLKSIDTSDIVKSADKLFELLDSVIEEIGETNVVQVVTDSAPGYVSAGEMLMEKRKNLFWSPCAAHCMDLILEDIGSLKVHKETLAKAKKITVFIYRHTLLLNMMRKYSDYEVIRAGVTRFATSYLTLSRMHLVKQSLRTMFNSDDWRNSSFAKKSDGKKVESLVMGDDQFWRSIKYCLKCVMPLVKVLRLVDGDAKPAMGYIYEAMDRAKEQIAKNFNGEVSRYSKVWKIIDDRWNLQLHRHLHAAAYYLNPRFHFDSSFDNNNYEVKEGLYTVIEKMCTSARERASIFTQLEMFHNAHGQFGRPMATAALTTSQPGLWWQRFGCEETKELNNLAIRILSLTCSATGCERNWSTFNQVHTKRRNRLAQQRMNALVYVKYNLQLEERQAKRMNNIGSYNPICLSDMESDDEWITEAEEPALSTDLSWMDIHDCFEEGEGSGSRKRKRGPRNLQHGRAPRGKVVHNEDSDEGDQEEEEFELSEDEERADEDQIFDMTTMDGSDD